MSTRRRPRKPITVAEAGRRAWKGTTKAQRSATMSERVWARWNFPCGQSRRDGHDNALCNLPECPGRQEAL